MQRQPTVDQMERMLSSMENKSGYLAGGVAGLGVIGSGDLGSRLLKEAPSGLDAAFLSAVLLAGALLGLSYVAFRSEGKRLSRMKSEQGLSESHSAPACFNRIGFKGVAYYAGFLLLIAAGFILLGGSWWGAWRS